MFFVLFFSNVHYLKTLAKQSIWGKCTRECGMCCPCLYMAWTGEWPRCGPALGLTSADRKICSAVKRNRMSAGKHTQRVGKDEVFHRMFFFFFFFRQPSSLSTTSSASGEAQRSRQVFWLSIADLNRCCRIPIRGKKKKPFRLVFTPTGCGN